MPLWGFIWISGHEEVVTWGNGQSGALGQGDESDLCVPTLVKYFQGIQISSVAAGWSHTAFLASKTSHVDLSCSDSE